MSRIVVLLAAALVAVAAFPVVFWFPAVFTPGRLMLALPLKDTPPIVRAVARVVAVAALPAVSAYPALIFCQAPRTPTSSYRMER